MPDCNILSFVTDHWDTLKDVFIEITNDPNSDQNSVRECDFFTAKFEELEFVLLVAIFKDIFQIVDEFSENLDKLKVVQVENLVNLLEEKQNETILNEHFKSIVSKTNTLCKDQDILCKKFKILYYNVLDSLILQVKTRFQDTINLRYTSLFEPLKYSSTHISMLHLVNSIEDRYSNFFSKFSRLKNEVQVYHKQQSKRTATPNFLSDLFEYSNIFQDLNKLFHLVVTLPCTRVSENEYSSCLKKIHDFQKNVVGRESVTISAKMVIEKELLEVLAEKQTFFEEVIDKFGNLEDTKIELVHKK
ncbi:uncharacterized protein LOC123010094 isoform X2 [Tribolium madens]|nr:uncharacterized protein LOC123010094 isoform X2 [Tribolium madens]